MLLRNTTILSTSSINTRGLRILRPITTILACGSCVRSARLPRLRRWCPACESAPSTRVCSACGSPAPRAPRPRRRSAQVLCTGGGRARRSGSGPRLVLAWRGGGGGCRGPEAEVLAGVSGASHGCGRMDYLDRYHCNFYKLEIKICYYNSPY